MRSWPARPGGGSPSWSGRPAGDPAAAGGAWPTREIAELVADLVPAEAPARTRSPPWSAPPTATRCTRSRTRGRRRRGRRPPRSPKPCWPRPPGSPHRRGRWSTRSASPTAGCPMNCWPRPSRWRRIDLLAAAREAVASAAAGRRRRWLRVPHDADPAGALRLSCCPGERRRLHRRLAGGARRAAEPDPALLAQHWHLADCPDRAAPAALLAARQAGRGARLPGGRPVLRPGHRLARWLPEAGPGLLEEAAQAASWAGDPGSRRPRGWRTRWPSPARPAPTTGPGCWSGSAVTGGKQEIPRPRSTPPSRRWRCCLMARPSALQARDPRCARQLTHAPGRASDEALPLAPAGRSEAEQAGADRRARARPGDARHRPGPAR